MTHAPFYSRHLATIHALDFASIWDGAAPWLAEVAKGSDGPAFVVDIGCGDGRMLACLRDLDVTGWGCDISEAFVEMARARGLTAVHGNASTLEFPSASLVIALGEVLSYRDDEGRAAFEAVLAEASRKLHAGGSFVFDLIGPVIAASTGWRSGEDWLVASTATPDAGVLRRDIVAFAKSDGVWSREDEVHTLTIFRPEEVEHLLRQAGFEVTTLDAVGNASLLPGRIAYRARRASRSAS